MQNSKFKCDFLSNFQTMFTVLENTSKSLNVTVFGDFQTLWFTAQLFPWFNLDLLKWRASPEKRPASKLSLRKQGQKKGLVILAIATSKLSILILQKGSQLGGTLKRSHKSWKTLSNLGHWDTLIIGRKTAKVMRIQPLYWLDTFKFGPVWSGTSMLKCFGYLS